MWLSSIFDYQLKTLPHPPPYPFRQDRISGQVFGQVLCLYGQVFAILKARGNAVTTMI